MSLLSIISPAKKLNYSAETRFTAQYSLPDFTEEAQILIAILRKLDVAAIAELMELSTQLATLNHERYQAFALPFTPENAKQALLTFNGDVYQSIKVSEYSEADFDYAQERLRILSGLYGLLRPLDLIQPYRLEMGTKLANERGKDLYAFWKETLTEALNKHIQAMKARYVVNLASKEYFQSIDVGKLSVPIITPVFKEYRRERYQSIFLYAKQARGAMADYLIRERIESLEALTLFNGMGYSFKEELSDEHNLVFVR